MRNTKKLAKILQLAVSKVNRKKKPIAYGYLNGKYIEQGISNARDNLVGEQTTYLKVLMNNLNLDHTEMEIFEHQIASYGKQGQHRSFRFLKTLVANLAVTDLSYKDVYLYVTYLESNQSKVIHLETVVLDVSQIVEDELMFGGLLTNSAVMYSGKRRISF